MNKPQRIITAIVLIVIFMVALRKKPEPPPDPAMPSVAAPIETVNALFARKPIRKGTHFRESALIVHLVERKKNIPKESLPAARILSDFRQLRDRIALEDIAPGEVLLGERIAAPDELGRVISDQEPLR